MSVIKFILQCIGLATIVWFVVIACEEYKKIQQEMKESENGHGS